PRRAPTRCRRARGPAPDHGSAAEHAALRDLGLWTAAADRAHGVHRHRVCQSGAADLRLSLSPPEATRGRGASGLPLLRASHGLRAFHPRPRRGLALCARPRRAAPRGRPGARHPVRPDQPLSALRPRHADRVPGAGVTGAIVGALLQALVVAVASPLLLGLVPTLKARLVGGREPASSHASHGLATRKGRRRGRRGPKPGRRYADLAKLWRKEVVISTATSWIFRFTPFVLV